MIPELDTSQRICKSVLSRKAILNGNWANDDPSRLLDILCFVSIESREID